jgi:hypothetical protein
VYPRVQRGQGVEAVAAGARRLGRAVFERWICEGVRALMRCGQRLRGLRRAVRRGTLADWERRQTPASRLLGPSWASPFRARLGRFKIRSREFCRVAARATPPRPRKRGGFSEGAGECASDEAVAILDATSFDGSGHPCRRKIGQKRTFGGGARFRGWFDGLSDSVACVTMRRKDLRRHRGRPTGHG